MMVGRRRLLRAVVLLTLHQISLHDKHYFFVLPLGLFAVCRVGIPLEIFILATAGRLVVRGELIHDFLLRVGGVLQRGRLVCLVSWHCARSHCVVYSWNIFAARLSWWDRGARQDISAINKTICGGVSDGGLVCNVFRLKSSAVEERARLNRRPIVGRSSPVIWLQVSQQAYSLSLMQFHT